MSIRRFLSAVHARKKLQKRDRLFLERQGRRRIQMHGLLGISGMCMLVGIYVPPLAFPRWWTAAWLLTILLMSWAILLALTDYISIRLFFNRTKREAEVEKMRLEYEIRRCREEMEQKDKK